MYVLPRAYNGTVARFELAGFRFEWDEDKAARNLKKHSLRFAEAAEVFLDPNAIFGPDPSESSEKRYYAIGALQDSELVVFVAYTERTYHGQETIRIISARKALAQERRRYYEPH